MLHVYSLCGSGLPTTRKEATIPVKIVYTMFLPGIISYIQFYCISCQNAF